MGDIRGRLLVGGRPHHRGEAGRAAVNKFNPPLPQDNVIGGAQPDVVVRDLFPGQVKFRLLQVTDRLLHFFVEEGGHSRVQGGGQVGEVMDFLYQRREQRPAPPEHQLAITQILHRDAQHGVDNGKIIGGVGKSDFLVGAIPGQRPGVLFLNTMGNLVRAPNGRG